MKRRSFVQLGSIMALPVQSFSEKFFTEKPANPGFNLKIFATNWGFEGSIDAFCSKVKKAGYDGLEVWWEFDDSARNELFLALEKHNLNVGFLCGGSQSDFNLHFESFKKAIDHATKSKIKPTYINCHSGRDYFSAAQNQKFIDYTTQASILSNIPIYHETHRSRMLFAAHISKQFMENDPNLKLTFDVSHWCNVAETLLADQPEAIKLAIERTGHIHARVGHQEGPQVNDPRAPEWKQAFEAHLAWWDKIVERKMQAGEQLTILTEFGPPTYLPTLPYTQQPLADQWDINLYMLNFLRKRYLK
jgi:sugar phosphate isomerase/epimerase